MKKPLKKVYKVNFKLQFFLTDPRQAFFLSDNGPLGFIS